MLFNELSRTGSPSQTTLGFLFLGALWVFGLWGTGDQGAPGCLRWHQVAAGGHWARWWGRSLHAAHPGDTHARYIPHAGIPHTPKTKNKNNPIANLSYSLQGFAVTSAPWLEPRPPPGPISQPCFKRHLLKTHRLHGHHRLPATILTIFYERCTDFTAVLFIWNTRTY